MEVHPVNILTLGNRYMYPLRQREAEILQVWWKLCSAHAHPWLNACDMHLLIYLLLHALTCMVNISSQSTGMVWPSVPMQKFPGEMVVLVAGTGG
jgi:hypothetical protein